MIGEKTFLPVIGGDFSIPMTVLNGKNPGKTGLITVGIHSEEFVGIESAIRLAGELREDQLFGKLYILHPLNLPGFQSSIRNSMVPEDGKNLNRVFPGKKEGSLSERIAYTVMSAFSEGIDFAIDLHGGQVHEELLPHVYFLGESKEEVKEDIVRFLILFNPKPPQEGCITVFLCREFPPSSWREVVREDGRKKR